MEKSCKFCHCFIPEVTDVPWIEVRITIRNILNKGYCSLECSDFDNNPRSFLRGHVQVLISETKYIKWLRKWQLTRLDYLKYKKKKGAKNAKTKA